MIPLFNSAGLLPQGVFWASWREIVQRFGQTPHRRALLAGLEAALRALRAAGCRAVYVDGSFVTAKEIPNDYDCCWDAVGVDPARLDPTFLNFKNKREAQKIKYGGEFFPAHMPRVSREGYSLNSSKLTRRRVKGKGSWQSICGVGNHD